MIWPRGQIGRGWSISPYLFRANVKVPSIAEPGTRRAGCHSTSLAERDLHLLLAPEGVHQLSGSLIRGRVVTPAWKAGARGLNAPRVRLPEVAGAPVTAS
jgi:hypothetical protein